MPRPCSPTAPTWSRSAALASSIPDWPHDVEAGRAIQEPPITASDLVDRAVSPMFANYLRRWKNLVAD